MTPNVLFEQLLVVGSCPCTLRLNTTGSLVDRHRVKKA